MVLYREDNIAQVRNAADIVEVIGEYVPLQKAGVNYKGLCPFHSEKTPSFIVNPDRSTFHCFGCGEGGNVFSFLMKHQHLRFPEAVKQLAAKYHVALPEEKLSDHDKARFKKRGALFSANEKAASLFHDFLLNRPGGKAALEYLGKRRIPAEIIETFQLGYAPESWDFLLKTIPVAGRESAAEAGLLAPNKRGGYYDRFRDRLVCPICDLSGRVIGFGGRILGKGEPKYLNTPETPIFNKGHSLYGLYQHKKNIQQAGQVVLVEGNFDLLALAAHRIDNVCAPLGTALTVQQIKILKRYTSEAVLLFDGDMAGLKAAMRAVPLFLNEQMEAKVVVLPPDHDPDTYVRDLGPERLVFEIKKARSLPEFVFEQLVAEHGLTLEGKGKIATELQSLIKALDGRNVQRSVFVSHFSRKLGLQPEQLVNFDQIKAVRVEVRKCQGKLMHEPPLKQRQFLEFILLYPEFFSTFLAYGIEKVMRDESARLIFQCMKNICREENSSVADRLLEEVSGPEKSLVSRLLVDPPDYSREKANERAGELQEWLKGYNKKLGREELTRLIHEAQHAGNEILAMELLEKKRELLEKKKEMDEKTTI